jgi:serpin B
MTRYLVLGWFAALVVVLSARGDQVPSQRYGAAVNAFGVNIYRAVAARVPGNVVISPYSAHAALMLVAEGARGETAAELLRVLGEEGDDLATLRGSGQTLRKQMEAAVTGAEAQAPQELKVANGLFGQLGYPFHTEFLELLAREHAVPRPRRRGAE